MNGQERVLILECITFYYFLYFIAYPPQCEVSTSLFFFLIHLPQLTYIATINMISYGR